MNKCRMDIIPFNEINEQFTINNIKRICKKHKINVFILTNLGEINYFVNNKKEKKKVEKYIDILRPCVNSNYFEVNKGFVINGFSMIQRFNCNYFKDKDELIKELRTIVYNSIKEKIKRFFNKFRFKGSIDE